MSKSSEVTLRISQREAEALINKGVKFDCDNYCRGTRKPLYTLTRLDNRCFWVDAGLEEHRLDQMDLSYLMNVHRMLICRPSTVLSFLLSDLNRRIRASECARSDCSELYYQIKTITSMSLTELNHMVEASPLFTSLERELKSRGVNVNNLVNFYSGDCHE